MAAQTRWAMANGVIPSAPRSNYLDDIDTEVLAAVRPEAMTIIR